MNIRTIYAKKAEKYARYRWDYAPAAIQSILTAAQVTPAACVADIGAGTGILTRHFVGRAGRVYAIEPNTEMRQEAEKQLAAYANCTMLDATAENIPLPDHSVDLITVAQAIHWMEPTATRKEFQRILKPGGWLAIVRNYGLDNAQAQALAQVMTQENGVLPNGSPATYISTPVQYYFGSREVQKQIFPFTFQQDWESFMGAICSASFTPEEDQPSYPRLEAAARKVFDTFSQDGWLEVCGETELYLGQPVVLPGED